MKGIDKKKVAKKLVRLRGKRRQTTVANELGISKQLLRAYEQGISVPGDDAKIKIAKYYGMTVGSLFYGEGKI